MITLIIVDCQNDFISGTMSVPRAKEILANIKEFINSNKNEIDKILFTVDWHPYNHCSFKRNGGQWPQHCVQFTPGACIEPKLLKFVQSTEIPYEVCTKGQLEEYEQYGAFDDIELVLSNPVSHYYFDSLYTADADSEFVICGIAGDYCVKETIKNLLNNRIIPKVFLKGIASIDGGIAIKKFIKEKELNEIV